MLIHIFTECWRWEYEEEIISSLRFCFFHCFKPAVLLAHIILICMHSSLLFLPAALPLRLNTHWALCFTIFFFLHRAYSPDNYNPIFFFASSFVWSDVFLCTRTWCSAKYRIRKRHAIAIFGNDFGKNFAFCFEF